ncbi:MAG: DMT family transporter [Verrucomicrobiae bacterium]|nr:DMT family transporter [Verrucomicrobiae bacterium]
MLAAVLTTLFFASSAAMGTRSASLIGPANANFVRLVVAALVLAAYAHTLGQGLGGPGLGMFMLGGLIGFGMGDTALYEAYDRIGSRLSILLCQCVAAPVAACVEWIWMGTRIQPVQFALGAAVLLGVALALAPGKGERPVKGPLWLGVGLGCIAALGQAAGAVLSRKGFAMCRAEGFALDGLTATYQRIWPGLVVAATVFVLIRVFRRPFSKSRLRDLPRERVPVAVGWVLGNALSGAVLGVACYQWALATTPSGVVLAIVAATPIAVMPLSWFMEGDRPTRRGVLGAAIAVSGVAGLALLPAWESHVRAF